MNRLFKLAVAGTLVFAMSACTDTGRTNQGANGNTGMTTKNVHTYGNNAERLLNTNPMNRWDNARNNNYSNSHDNTRMEMSQAIADRIATIPDVKSANVLLTDKNAYVAVVLKNATTGTGGDLTGIGTGHRGSMSARGTANQGDLGMQRALRGTDASDNRIGTGTHRTGAGMTAADDVSFAMKQRIANLVKSMHPDVQNVYVSASPGFVDRLNSYADRVRNGQPLRGLILEFNTAVQRLFPHAVNPNANTGANTTGSSVTGGR